MCLHLLETKDIDYKQCFTGEGLAYDLVCSDCARSLLQLATHLRTVCLKCFEEIQEEGYWDGIVGEPEVLERPTKLYFTHQTFAFPEALPEKILDIQPITGLPQGPWLALTAAGELVTVDPASGVTSVIAHLPPSGLSLETPVTLHLSPDCRTAAIVNTFGQHGIVLDLDTGQVTMRLQRDTYHSNVSAFSLAFFELDHQLFLIHGTAWNRLDASDPRTGRLVTARSHPPYTRGAPPPEHYLDYFHSSISVSPDQEWVSDNGWVWHPVGVITTWNLRRWIVDNPWESEDGASKKSLCSRDYYWDGPVCWIDARTLVMWGYGNDDEWLIPAVRLFDVESGTELRWFAGPQVARKDGTRWPAEPMDALVFDTYLFSLSEKHGIAVWDVVTGERLLHDATLHPTRYHRDTKQFLTLLPDGMFRLSRLIVP